MNVASMLEGFALLMLFIIMAAFLYFVAKWFLELINNHFKKKNPENDVSFQYLKSTFLIWPFFQETPTEMIIIK